MLDLSDFTICAADSINTALTARALHLSKNNCKFGDAIFFSHVPVDGEFRTEKIAKLDMASYQAFRLKLPPVIKTPFVLFVEWDGYVIEPRAWHPSFREYDYIGAKWIDNAADGMNVGNSGFCLQSKRLLDALADPRFVPLENQNVDLLICRTYRPILEREFGIRFAPESVADLFSYENAIPRQPTFGFHGLANMWRYMSDAEILSILDRADPYVFRTGHFVLLIFAYALQSKFAIIGQLFRRMLTHVSRDEALVAFRRAVEQPHGDRLFAMCEQLMACQYDLLNNHTMIAFSLDAPKLGGDFINDNNVEHSGFGSAVKTFLHKHTPTPIWSTLKSAKKTLARN